jgi:cyclic beta-1,2-glucan synthetase
MSAYPPNPADESTTAAPRRTARRREKRRTGWWNRLRRLFHGPGDTQGPVALPDLVRWARDLYLSSGEEQPLHGAVFTVDQLEMHARALAASHRPGRPRRDDGLLRRLGDSERVIGRCHQLLLAAQEAGSRLASSAQWLLDNHWLIEEQVQLARRHFPPGYSRQLPRVASGAAAGVPRIHDIILEFVVHVDGRVDEEALARYLCAYQEVTPLTLGELWSVPIMLRLALVESLRRVTVNMSWQRAHRDNAIVWARRFDAIPDRQEGAFQVLADLVGEKPPLSPAFVTQFTLALQGRGSTTTLVLAWLEQQLADRGQTLEGMVGAESQRQGADHASMSNTISSLRLVNSMKWPTFVEAHSIVEDILRGETAAVYHRMDFATRDRYRHVVESLARRFRLDEITVAREVVALADAAQPGKVAAHSGYWLVDDGRVQLERVLGGAKGVLPRPSCRSGRLQLPAYLGLVGLFTGLGMLLLAPLVIGAAGPATPLLLLCAALAASQAAIAMVNWLATMLRSPRPLPRMDFEEGIPDDCLTIAVVPTMLSGPERIASMLEGLELRYLANRDPNLCFALLTDHTDSGLEHAPEDAHLLELAAAGIGELNARYNGDQHGCFLLFHRPRLYNPQEGCWMGRERKRGKLEDFNDLLCGGTTAHFSRIVGDLSRITGTRYVITLDTDTDLPWGAGWRLIGAAAHPLSHPVLDATGRNLLCGYAILQPRVGISCAQRRTAAATRSSWPDDVGFDPYTHAWSPTCIRICSPETSFVGKGIYDVGRVPAACSTAGSRTTRCSATTCSSRVMRARRSAATWRCSKTHPRGICRTSSRRHRWMRGDWQIAPWLGLRVERRHAAAAIYPSPGACWAGGRSSTTCGARSWRPRWLAAAGGWAGWCSPSSRAGVDAGVCWRWSIVPEVLPGLVPS